MRFMRFLVLCIALVTVLSLVGCNSGGSSSSGGEQKVSMKDMAFSPKEITIKAGTTVTFVNDDMLDHSVVQGDPAKKGTKGLFQTDKDLKPNEKFSYKFEKAGEYTVYCNTAGHDAAGMIMKVKVN